MVAHKTQKYDDKYHRNFWKTVGREKQSIDEFYIAIKRSVPTGNFAILQTPNQDFSEFYVVQKRHATDFEVPKLWKGRSGKNLLVVPERASQESIWQYILLFNSE